MADHDTSPRARPPAEPADSQAAPPAESPHTEAPPETRSPQEAAGPRLSWWSAAVQHLRSWLGSLLGLFRPPPSDSGLEPAEESGSGRRWQRKLSKAHAKIDRLQSDAERRKEH